MSSRSKLQIRCCGFCLLLSCQIVFSGQSIEKVHYTDDDNWSDQFALYGLNGPVHAIATQGGAVYVGGQFTKAGGVNANNIARWNGSSWSYLGSGITGAYPATVRAIGVSGDQVYAGGFFGKAGGANIGWIARWDGTSWHGMGSGLDGPVYGIACKGTEVYAGGAFTTADGKTVNHIARWDGSGWHALGNGVDGAVTSITIDGNDLYVGGEFIHAGGMEVNHVAKWDGSNWIALEGGVNQPVNSLIVKDGALYCGGNFTQAGVKNIDRIARWDGNSWSGLGSGLNNSCLILDEVEDVIFAGGLFTMAGGESVNYIAMWDGNQWHPLGSGVGSTLFPFVEAMASIGYDLYVGGDFITAGGKPSHYIGLWHGSELIPDPPPKSRYNELTFFDDFGDGNSDGWIEKNLSRWSVIQDHGDWVYTINTSDYSAGPNGELGEHAIIDGYYFDHFWLTCDVKCLEDRSVNHFADYCFIFGYQNENDYYYMMFNQDETSTALYKMTSEGRMEIASTTGNWIKNSSFNEIQIMRWASEIWVYYNSLLVLYSDDACGPGFIGIGSYNDAASFDDIQIKIGLSNPKLPPSAPSGSTIGFNDDFEDGDHAGWTEKNTARWGVFRHGGSHALCIKTSDYEVGVNGRLGEYAIVDGSSFTDFWFRCRAKCFEDRSVNLFADFCIIFGYQNENDYYYMMFNQDETSTGLYKVSPEGRSEAAMATGNWIKNSYYNYIQLLKIDHYLWVYYNSEIVLLSDNVYSGEGQIGVGSYNDAAAFDDVTLMVGALEPPDDYAKIEITDPNDQDLVWREGERVLIEWNYSTGSGSHVKIELRKNETWVKNIVTSTPNDGSYEWIVSGDLEHGCDYRIKIISVSNGFIFDISDHLFRITPLYTYSAYHILGSEIPVLDGSLNDSVWSFLPQQFMLWDTPTIAWIDGENTSVSWKAVWCDETNRLYVAVDVKDDVRSVFDNGPDSGNYKPWHDDSIEFYTDGDHSGGDYWQLYGPAQQWRVTGDNHRDLYNYPNPEGIHLYEGDDFITTIQQGENGNWSCEAVFTIYDDLPDQNHDLSEGDTIGWEIRYNDSDNTNFDGTCYLWDHQIGWCYYGYNAFRHATLFGDMVLNGEVENHPPVAVDDSVSTYEYTEITIAVLENDTDQDGDALSIDSIDTTASLGHCVIGPGNTIVTYTPPEFYLEEDFFSYTVTDNRGGLDTALVVVLFDAATGIKTESKIPGKFVLQQNYPNPFNFETKIGFEIKHQSQVILKIYNLQGVEAATLCDEPKSIGFHEVVWNADNFCTGVYFYRIEAKSIYGEYFSEIGKCVLIK